VTVKARHPRDAGFVTVEEIRATAIGNLPRDVADYLEAGAGTERTLRANREAFGRWVMTVDCTLPGFRTRDRMNRFSPDMSVFSGNVAGDGTPSVAETFGPLFSDDMPAWDWRFPSCSTAESAPAPTCSSRWRSARTRC